MSAQFTPGPWVKHPLMAWVCPASDMDAPICLIRQSTEAEGLQPDPRGDAR